MYRVKKGGRFLLDPLAELGSNTIIELSFLVKPLTTFTSPFVSLGPAPAFGNEIAVACGGRQRHLESLLSGLARRMISTNS